MENGCVQVNWIHRYHEQKFIALRKVPTNYIQNLTLWCMDWDKWMHQLVTLEHKWRLIQRWGKDGSDQQFRKDLSHNGAVRWEVIERFSEWPLKQYIRWQSAAGDWYVDCGNWNYCHILDNQCGILYCTNDKHIAHALQMGQQGGRRNRSNSGCMSVEGRIRHQHSASTACAEPGHSFSSLGRMAHMH